MTKSKAASVSPELVGTPSVLGRRTPDGYFWNLAEGMPNVHMSSSKYKETILKTLKFEKILRG